MEREEERVKSQRKENWKEKGKGYGKEQWGTELGRENEREKRREGKRGRGREWTQERAKGGGGWSASAAVMSPAKRRVGEDKDILVTCRTPSRDPQGALTLCSTP